MDFQNGIRLNPLPIVKNQLENVQAPLIILKPIVESHRTVELLNHFENSRAIWIYRNYKDVAVSNIRRFGEQNPISDLAAVIGGAANNWRAESVPPDVEEFLRTHFSSEMASQDAAVLFWYMRNRLFFDLELEKNPKVILCRYESLAKHPQCVMPKLYDFLGQKYPGRYIYKYTHSHSIKKGRDLTLDPEINNTAVSLLQRLDSTLDQSVHTLSSQLKRRSSCE